MADNPGIKNHKIAVKKLEAIKAFVFKLIRQNIGKISEYDVAKLILAKFKENNLSIDKANSMPIVAVDKNSASPHYLPAKKSLVIKENNLVLIDIWAKESSDKAIFADITWVGYSGHKTPPEIEATFKSVIGARKIASDFIKNNLKNKILPKGKEVDKCVREYFKNKKIEKYFIHNTGHSLGACHCHGKIFNLSKKNRNSIKLNTPFTIEPGIYYKDKFGVRSEINCYIDRNYQLVITTKMQNGIIKI